MPMAAKLGRVGICNEKLPSIKSQGHFITGLARSREKFNTSYLHYHNDHGQQTWPVGGYMQ